MGNRKRKTVDESRSVMHRLVMPEDSNTLGTLMGGVLMHWMDMCAAIAARRHSNTYAMTVTVDRIQFVGSVRVGEVVNLEAEVTRAFRTSMEIGLRVIAENLDTGEKRLCASTFYSFVAVDRDGSTLPVPEVIPETDGQKKRYRDAEERRSARLEDAGRIREEAEAFDRQQF
ncbi:MAG: acyl-CoA thioesterase [Balneolaceae bacterium]|nr:MAG: acyl-CoA thioesterase [Balneolaceae bacterium]